MEVINVTDHEPDRYRVLRITTSFDGPDLPSAVLKCRKCKVCAEGTNVDGENVTILCPNCGVRIDGDLAHTMYLNQSQYLLVKELRKTFADEFGSSRYFSYEPGDELSEPDWPFFLDFET